MIKVRLVKKIEGVEVQNGDTIILGLKVGMAGASAYQSYLATTTDDPKLTEAQWSATFNGVESVTSTDNHIVVDNTDPKNPVLSFQLVDNENLLTDDELAIVQATSGTNTGDQDLSPYQTITDDLLETDSDTIVGAINEVNSIAKGANQALSFDDYQAVIAAMLVSGLNAGQNLYVDTLDVPDLWVKVVEVASVPYTYVSDEQFVTDILAGTQIGYYRLALLETQKVDLTNYYTKDETDQAIEDYASPLGHNHSGEDIEPESVTTDQIVLNGFDRLGNPITVNLVYNTDLGVVEFQYPDGTVGQDHLELWFVAKCQGTCRNGYGAQFVSSQGGHIVVKEMIASELNTQPQLFMGIFTQTAVNGEFIKITWFGSVNDVSTTAYEAEGGAKILYVDMEGSGLRGFTTIIPNAPYRKIMAASIQKYSTGASENGVILVRPTFGTKLSDLDDVDGVETTVTSGNSFIMKLASGLWKTITESNFVTWLNNTFFTKTDSDRRFVNQNGGTIYHITKWFTPTSALTIAANGLSATITSGQFTSAMTGAKLKLTGGVNEPIITYVSTNQINLSFAVDSAFFGQSIAIADWGVYSKAITFDSNGFINYYTPTGSKFNYIDSSGNLFYNTLRSLDNKQLINSTDIFAPNDFKIKWSNDGTYYGTKDLGLRRLAAGILEIYDGITNGVKKSLSLLNIHKTGYDYFDASPTADTVNDIRTSNVAGVKTIQICTVANATKGSGTWSTIYTLDTNGFVRDEYDDILPGMGWVDAAGGAAPDTAAHTIAGIAVNFKAFDGGTTTEAMTNAFEITHAIDVDALNRATAPLIAEIHTHGMAATTGSGVVKIFYDLVYQPVNAAPIAWGTFSNLITINANEQYWHKLGGVELPKPSSGYNIGDQIIVKYYRVPTDAQDTYAGDWLFKQCAMHMPLNSNGSRQRYVK